MPNVKKYVYGETKHKWPVSDSILTAVEGKKLGRRY